MSEKKFSKQHEWISVEGDIATVGITKHASEMLGDVVFVELEYAFPVPEPLVVPLVVVPAFQHQATYFSVLVFTLTSAST